MLKHAGFRDVRFGKEVDVFSGSEHESDAKDFDTRGVTILAQKHKNAGTQLKPD